MAHQLLFYIELIYILLSLLHMSSSGSTDDCTVIVRLQTSETSVNASAGNFSVDCKAACGFLHFAAIYSGDSGISGVVDMNGGPTKLHMDQLKADVLFDSNHDNFKGDCNVNCLETPEDCRLKSSLQVSNPAVGNYFFFCYTETTSGYFVYSTTKAVKVVNDEVPAPPSPHQPSPTPSPSFSLSTPDISSDTTTPSSLQLVQSPGLSTGISALSPSSMITSGCSNPISSVEPDIYRSQIASWIITSTVTETVHHTSSHCATSSTSSPLPEVPQSTTTSSTNIVRNNMIEIEENVAIAGATSIGFLLVLAVIVTLTVIILGCVFVMKIRRQPSRVTSSNGGLGFVNQLYGSSTL